ncbi:MAG: hypothetical protein A3F73_02610 [Gallionellales bacterium RIFCSPLOWO2_12_FULL_59_22]|nr:MAG: hypothetical protein A3F73_02610 [Gallionellales bacterium RIFCSPLOWO2_12_FULL_59_22]
MKTLHGGKQDGGFLLAQIRKGFAQDLPGIHGQRHAAPSLLRIEKWRSYPAGLLENGAQVAMNAPIIGMTASRFRI